MKHKSSKIEKEFVPYDLVLRMKRLGFDEPCFNLYDFKTKELMYEIPNIGEVEMFKYDNHNKTNHISAPLYQQAFRWFREKYRLKHIWVMDELLDTGEYTYEEAELACLKYCIEIVESK
jgi:hypothetical protein